MNVKVLSSTWRAAAPGSIDVIEIDAACHGASTTPASCATRPSTHRRCRRYKVYIIDEAHMVSTQGFNALLKVVEEPPEHVKFVFATTEPEKVIGTIRSRTHHYPFRLVPSRISRTTSRRSVSRRRSRPSRAY